MDSEALTPGTQLTPLYLVGEQVRADLEPQVFRGTCVADNKLVWIFEIDPRAAAAYELAKSIDHNHLAKIYDVVEHAGHHYLINEEVNGQTLDAYLDWIGPMSVVDVVRAMLRIVEGLTALHRLGIVHGFVHPASVVMEPEHRPGPVLTFMPGAQLALPFLSPERQKGANPSEADDAWAMAGILFKMLVGEPPNREGYETEAELTEAGIEDAALSAALLAALHREHAHRNKSLRPLRRALARWFVENASEGPVARSVLFSSVPPPLPDRPSHPPRPSQVSSVPPSRPFASILPEPRPSVFFLLGGNAKVPVLAVCGMTLGLLLGWLYSSMHNKPRVKTVAVAAPNPKPAPISLSDVPVTATPGPSAPNPVTACVVHHLPGSFDKFPDMSFVCNETDARVGADKLRVNVVAGAENPGVPSEAMTLIWRLGAHDMAAFALLRAACCENPGALQSPSASATCTPLTERLAELSSAVLALKSAEEPVKALGSAIDCEIEKGRNVALRLAPRGDKALLDWVQKWEN